MIARTPAGLFCEAGNVYVDPWEPVERARVTHAHSDHARPGCASHLCATPGAQVLRRRIPDAVIQTLPDTEGMRGKARARSRVLAPLSARGTPWMRRLPHASVAFASGLMRVRGVRRQRAFDRGFVLSDHADWGALVATVAGTGASRVLVTHGWSEALARFLAEARGLETGTIRTARGGDGRADRNLGGQHYFFISAAIACTLVFRRASWMA